MLQWEENGLRSWASLDRILPERFTGEVNLGVSYFTSGFQLPLLKTGIRMVLSFRDAARLERGGKWPKVREDSLTRVSREAVI